MQVKIFDVISLCAEEELEQLNKFLRGHKVLEVDRQFYVSSDGVGHWSFMVLYLQGVASQSTVGEKREKIDYKTVLGVEEFERFTKLRLIRKQLAADDAVPAYAVFSDAELAQIAQLPSVEASAMVKITGIGERRVEKYGRLMCELFNREQG